MENDEDDEGVTIEQAKYEFKVHTPRRMPPVPVYSIYVKPFGRNILKGHLWLQMKPGPKEKAEELARDMQEHIFALNFRTDDDLLKA